MRNGPNRKDSQDVPKSSSLSGDHFIHGNYTPDIKFAVGERHDFMAPVEFYLRHGRADGQHHVPVEEDPHGDRLFRHGDRAYRKRPARRFIWSSSDAHDPGYGLMSYLPPADVKPVSSGTRWVMGPEVDELFGSQGDLQGCKRGGAAIHRLRRRAEHRLIRRNPGTRTKPHEFIWAVETQEQVHRDAPDSGWVRASPGREKQEETARGAEARRVPRPREGHDRQNERDSGGGDAHGPLHRRLQATGIKLQVQIKKPASDSLRAGFFIGGPIASVWSIRSVRSVQSVPSVSSPGTLYPGP